MTVLIVLVFKGRFNNNKNNNKGDDNHDDDSFIVRDIVILLSVYCIYFIIKTFIIIIFLQLPSLFKSHNVNESKKRRRYDRFDEL